MILLQSKPNKILKTIIDCYNGPCSVKASTSHLHCDGGVRIPHVSTIEFIYLRCRLTQLTHGFPRYTGGMIDEEEIRRLQTSFRLKDVRYRIQKIKSL